MVVHGLAHEDSIKRAIERIPTDDLHAEHIRRAAKRIRRPVDEQDEPVHRLCLALVVGTDSTLAGCGPRQHDEQCDQEARCQAMHILRDAIDVVVVATDFPVTYQTSGKRVTEM
jgi:hypothetical protein